MRSLLASEPVYTVDWTSAILPVWRERLVPLALMNTPRILEIGAFEGRTTRWMLEVFPRASIVVVDPFTGGSDQTALSLDGMYARFQHNIAPFADRVKVFPERSSVALPSLLATLERFDFIYVDGSHEAADVLFDAVCAFHLCRPGGLICFDDYAWSADAVPAQFTPKVAIDAFMAIHADRVRRIGEPDRQLWMQKDGWR